MKTFLILSAALAVSLAGASTALAQRPILRPPAYEHEHEEGRLRRRDRQPVQIHPHGHAAEWIPVIRQRAEAIAYEIDYVQEHLEGHLEEGHADRAMAQLFRQADATLAEAIHFHDSLRPGSTTREIADHFRVLDKQVHALMEMMQATNDPVLRRAVSRLAFADEQLYAAVGTPAGQAGPEFIARQAHVLAGEAQRLERSARAIIASQDHREGGDHRADRQLLDALHDFTDKVEHFHETAEHEDDAEHIAEDFQLVDRSWHRVVELMNQNPHGAYLSRRAQRVGSMHDDLSRVIGVRAERRLIRFNIGNIGIDLRP
jgi:hypothetical protein